MKSKISMEDLNEKAYAALNIGTEYTRPKSVKKYFEYLQRAKQNQNRAFSSASVLQLLKEARGGKEKRHKESSKTMQKEESKESQEQERQKNILALILNSSTPIRITTITGKQESIE